MRLPLITLSIVALAALSACTPSQTTTTTDTSSSSVDAYATSSVAEVSSESISSAAASDSSADAMSSAASQAGAWDGTYLKGMHTAVLQTSKGNITIELNADASPKTVTNFVTLAKAGYYNGLTFHRVIPGFMIQGGDPNGNGTGGQSIYGPTFADEISNAPDLYKIGYKKGVVAMANAGPNTNGSQFFIMESDYALSPDYTIFGKVTSGQDVVSTIAAVPRDSSDKPLQPVTFTVQVQK